MSSDKMESSHPRHSDWLTWRVAAIFRMLLWRGSQALEKMIYRPHQEMPVEQRLASVNPFPEATWHWEKDCGYVIADHGPKSVTVMAMHPLSEN